MSVTGAITDAATAESARQRAQFIAGLAVLHPVLVQPGEAPRDDGTGAQAPTGVGAQWIRAPNGCYHCGAWWEDVNWRTGEVRETREGDPRLYEDLNAPALTAPLCAPLRVTRTPPGHEPSLTTVTVRGGWVVIRRGQGAALYRCATANPVALPGPISSPALGDGWVGQLSRRGRGAGRTVDLLRLSDRRHFTVRTMPAAARSSGSLTFTHGRR